MKPEVKNIRVICTSCEGVSRLAIVNKTQILYKDHVPIISARLRPDGKWGFECQCGNDSRVAPEEKDNLDFIVQGGQHAIKKIAKSLIPKNENKFRMEAA